MGNFEKLSVLVIVVIIVMILVVALYTWTGDPSGGDTGAVVPDPAPRVVTQDLPRVDLPKLVGGDASPKPRDAKTVLDEILRREKDRIVDTRRDGTDGGGPAPAPAPTPEPAPAPAPKEPKLYTVVDGDSIGKICKREYPGAGQRAIDLVLKANATVDPTRMRVGTKLVLPDLPTLAKVDGPGAGAPGIRPVSIEPAVATIRPGTVYTTKKGDTLPGIARRAYKDSNQWHRIWVENFDEISDTEQLAPGMRLRIPVLN